MFLQIKQNQIGVKKNLKGFFSWVLLKVFYENMNMIDEDGEEKEEEDDEKKKKLRVGGTS